MIARSSSVDGILLSIVNVSTECRLRFIFASVGSRETPVYPKADGALADGPEHGEAKPPHP